MEEVSKENLSTIERDVYLTPHGRPTMEDEYEHSEDEMFYSPPSESVNVDRQPFLFAEPKSLFQEISDTAQTQGPDEEVEHVDFIEADEISDTDQTQGPDEEDEHVDYIVADCSPKENLNESNKTITFAFSEPSNDTVEDISMFKSETPINAEALLVGSPAILEKSVKPPRKTFVFSKPNPVYETVEPETEHQEVDKEVEETPAQDVDFIFKTPMAVDKSSRQSRTFVFGKQFTAMQARASETRLQDESVRQSEASKVESSFAFRSPSAKDISNPSMTFTAPKKASAEEVESVLQELNNRDSQLKSGSQTLMDAQTPMEENRRISKYNFTFTKSGPSKTDEQEEDPQLKTDSQTSMDAQIPIEENRRTSKYNFTFSKSGPSKTDKRDEKRTVSDYSMPVSDISSFSLQSEVKSKPSRRNFTFSKKLPRSESASVQEDNETEIKDSLLQRSEKSKDKVEFIKAAAETYEEFSTSLKKSKFVLV